MQEIKWGGDIGPWTVVLDMRQEYDPHRQVSDGDEYLAGYNIASASGQEIVGIEGIIPGGLSEINARAIALVPEMIVALGDARGCLAAHDEEGRDTMKEISRILNLIGVDFSG